jgi:hypothetical protein
VVKYPNERTCPVRERTGDGTPVGRCFHFCPNNVCPRHGDVSAPLALYRETSALTDERVVS